MNKCSGLFSNPMSGVKIRESMAWAASDILSFVNNNKNCAEFIQS